MIKFAPLAQDTLRRVYRRYGYRGEFSLEFSENQLRAFIISKFKRKWLRSEDWKLWSHQYCGLACNHLEFWGKEIPIRPVTQHMFAGIHHQWLDSASIFESVSFSRIQEYVQQIARLGMTAEHSYGLLNEALYPLDYTEKNLKEVAGMPLEPLHDDTLLPFSDYKIVILGENSD